MNTPIAFIIFNRPDATRRVFAAIANQRPKRLLVVADGPRNVEEQRLCEETREVLKAIDWNCELLTNFADHNLGCKRRVSSGLDWIFEHCEEAIILEDDCLPQDSFFPYCEELLARFRNDPRVGMICGSNFQRGRRRSENSYFFLLNVTAWGWASWRRVWRDYDVAMKSWPDLRDTSWLSEKLQNPIAEKYWRDTFESTYAGSIDTWDYQFFFSWWKQNALAISPARNLVSNIGFGSMASHTRDTLASLADLPTEPMSFPLTHPAAVVRNIAADNFAFRQICPWIIENQSYYWQLRHRIGRSLPDPVRQTIRHLRAKAQKLRGPQ